MKREEETKEAYCDIHDRNWRVYSNGRVTREGECVLFPSKDNRDWSTFKIPENEI